jgi:hypothetical protein
MPACTEETRTCIDWTCSQPSPPDLCWWDCIWGDEFVRDELPCFECVDCVVTELFACLAETECGAMVTDLRCCWEPIGIVLDPYVCIGAAGSPGAEAVDEAGTDAGGVDGGPTDGGPPDAGEEACARQELDLTACAAATDCLQRPVSDHEAARCFE